MPWCGSSTERGLSSFSGIFYKLKDVLLRSRAGPAVGTEPRAQGLASESLLSQEPTGPHVLCLPSRLWSPRLGGGVWRSRQAESSRRAPCPQPSLGYPKPVNKWSQGSHAGSGHLDWCQGRGPSSAPAPVRTPTPWRGALVTSSRWLTRSAYAVVSQLGELSKRSPCGISPIPWPRTGRPSPGISAPRSAGP